MTLQAKPRQILANWYAIRTVSREALVEQRSRKLRDSDTIAPVFSDLAKEIMSDQP